VRRVGAFVIASTGSVTLRVYDAADNMLESRAISKGNVSVWKNNFIGIERTEGIRRVAIIGNIVAADGLTFEYVPEPSTLLLTCAWIPLLLARARAESSYPLRVH
jgi:hypothetical protein